MKRVLLLGFGRVSHMPYINLYIDSLKNSEIDLVCWERECHADVVVPKGINQLFIHTDSMENSIPLRDKLLHFQRYRRFVCKILCKKRYDLVVSMQAAPGLVLLDKLIHEYKNRYILDFRDLSYEHIRVYRILTGILARKARVVFVSSNAFRKYLPENIPIRSVHNYLEESLHINGCMKERSIRPIRICFWGLLRAVDTNCRLMDAIGNDDRFELHYYGRLGAYGNSMKHYAEENGFQNVLFHGEYAPNERYSFIANADIVHNAFDLNRTMKNAVSNKYYDGMIFSIPQICTKGSHMGDLVTEHNVGLAVDFSREDIAEQIWSYFMTINMEQFELSCKETMKRVCEEQASVKQLLKNIEIEV